MNLRKNIPRRILALLGTVLILITAVILPISATEETTENDASNFSITEGNWGTSVYTDLREMVNCTVYPDNINTTNIEERDNSNYYYDLSLPVGTVVPWEYFSDMRKGSTYLDGKGQPSAIRAVVGYTLENVFDNRELQNAEIYDAKLTSGEYHDGYLNLYVYTVTATDAMLNPLLKEKNPNASFYFLFSLVDRNSIGVYSSSGGNVSFPSYQRAYDYIAFPCTKVGDDYVIGQAYKSAADFSSEPITGANQRHWHEIAEIKDNRIELWGWQTYNLDGTYTNISDSFYFKLNPSVLGLFQVLDGRTVPYTYLQLIQSYGYDEGYWSGHSEGYDDGLQQGRKNWYQPRYDQGYEDGKNTYYWIGIEDGKEEGYHNGFQDGRSAGITEAVDTGSELRQTIFAIVESPIRLIEQTLDFNFLGFNLASLVKGFISIVLVAAVVFIIFKFIK